MGLRLDKILEIIFTDLCGSCFFCVIIFDFVIIYVDAKIKKILLIFLFIFAGFWTKIIGNGNNFTQSSHAVLPKIYTNPYF